MKKVEERGDNTSERGRDFCRWREKEVLVLGTGCTGGGKKY